MELAEFIRIFPMRKGQLMWLLGAGCSVAAGIPTASDMIMDFKRLLFCSESRKSLNSVPKLADPSFRSRLSHYMASQPGFPEEGSAEEYSFYFEKTYREERERRRYISEMIRGAGPSFGHHVLARLIDTGYAPLIWTTNFDRLVEDAYVEHVGSSNELVVASTDNASVGQDALMESSSRLLVKLHGDFHSRKLKNTEKELQEQDATLREMLTDACCRFGLIVVGYSGRDRSVMSAIAEAIRQKGALTFPGGLFWIVRPNSELGHEVRELLELAEDAGINACSVEAASFDEFSRDICSLLDGVAIPSNKYSASAVDRLSACPIPTGGADWPVIRLNALPVLEFPSVARLVECDAGGTSAIRDHIATTGLKVSAIRKRYGVICFGSDQDVRSAFEPFDLKGFTVHSLDLKAVQEDRSLLGLFNELIAIGMAKHTGLSVCRRGRSWFLSFPAKESNSSTFNRLKGKFGLSGRVPNTTLQWHSAISIRLQVWLDRLWLIFEPTDVVDLNDCSSDDKPTQSIAVEAVKEFRRERSATTYNRQLNELFDCWVEILAENQDGNHLCFRAFGVGDGIDAVFRLSKITAFSRRL